jgi:hypothetical protein
MPLLTKHLFSQTKQSVQDNEQGSNDPCSIISFSSFYLCMYLPFKVRGRIEWWEDWVIIPLS